MFKVSSMAGKKHINYYPEFRYRAVQQLLTSGGSIPEIVQLLKINERTLSGWLKAEREVKAPADGNRGRVLIATGA